MVNLPVTGLLAAAVATITATIAATDATTSTQLQLPRLLGSYPVGTVNLEVTDHTRTVPSTATNASTNSTEPRRLMVSVFYPTTNATTKNGNASKSSSSRSRSSSGNNSTYQRAPYFASATSAAAFATYLGNATTLLTNLATWAYADAPLAATHASVLLFSHGLGSSRLLHAAFLADLASRGWIVVAPDHPYDAWYTEYPDGSVARMPDAALDDFPNELPGLVDTRVKDITFLAGLLQNGSLWRGLSTSSTVDIGILGHSLGGNTAAQTVARSSSSSSSSSSFPCGANFDGGIFGPVAATGLDRPFLQIGAANHNQTTDATFSHFWSVLHGFRRELTVNSTVHQSFMDLPVLRDVLGDEFPVDLRNQSGTAPGARLLQIETTLVDAFFRFCLTKTASSDDFDQVAKSLAPDIWPREVW
ncbi:uncharacterized protein SPSK_10777 [Sporothrix schenckii 1099-18]|uniref:1-alkyl-2-acetylglycerophosphocholine esterase n=1 Tax=Sporothrix schenckii 1099-18 TaxID=1397361 RepID=A0A0F2MHG0_SPOSC|nr:uncharacterized protein SPSK_10777 [Sporothrix schenckii 1099-18]KJR88484.1 hypothetical protein SPSK_10777 [Sporothrix schenckii 1099-18]